MYALKITQYPGGEVRSSVTKVSTAPRKKSPLVSGFQNGTIDGVGVSDSSGAPHTSPLSPDPRSKKSAPPQFTLIGKRKLKRVVAAMEDFCPKEQTRFATATFPAWTVEAQEALASQVPYFNDRIQSWLRKRSPNIAWAYCWEFQKRGALHCHWILGCSDPAVQLPTTQEWADEVGRLITAMSSATGINLWKGRGGVDWSKQRSKLRADCQEVRKSVGSYLAKYLSKAKSAKGTVFYPKRWWGASGLARQWVAELTSETVLSMGRLSRVLADSESLLGDLDPLCDSRFRYKHRYSLGHTDVLYFSDRNVVSQILEFSWMKRKQVSRDTKCSMDGLRRSLLLLSQNQSAWGFCSKSASQPLKMAMMSFICSKELSQKWDWASTLELKLLVLESPMEQALKHELSLSLSRVLRYELAPPDPVLLPELRESVSVRGVDGTATQSDGDTGRPRPIQKSLFSSQAGLWVS